MTSLPAAAFDAETPGAAAMPAPWAGSGRRCPVSGQRLQRSAGTAELAFRADGGTTRLERAWQSGCARLRLPRQHDVPFPTAGGLTGGDRLSAEVTVGAGAQAVVTGQAAEKIYRSAGGVAAVDNRLLLGPGARLDWLPQETILFDGGALERRTTVDMAADARLTATELVIFGRQARGETVAQALLADAWRVRRDGRLLFAEATRLAGPVHDLLRRPATGAGAIALALVVHVAPDAEGRLQAVRDRLAEASGVEAGASAFDGMVAIRLLARSGQALRAAVLDVLAPLRDGLPPPRPWLV